MPHSIKDLDLSELTGAERILLAQELWDSARQEAEALPLTPEQHAEIQRRVAALDAGTMPTHRWDDVKQRLLNRK